MTKPGREREASLLVCLAWGVSFLLWTPAGVAVAIAGYAFAQKLVFETPYYAANVHCLVPIVDSHTLGTPHMPWTWRLSPDNLLKMATLSFDEMPGVPVVAGASVGYFFAMLGLTVLRRRTRGLLRATTPGIVACAVGPTIVAVAVWFYSDVWLMVDYEEFEQGAHAQMCDRLFAAYFVGFLGSIVIGALAMPALLEKPGDSNLVSERN